MADEQDEHVIPAMATCMEGDGTCAYLRGAPAGLSDCTWHPRYAWQQQVGEGAHVPLVSGFFAGIL